MPLKQESKYTGNARRTSNAREPKTQVYKKKQYPLVIVALDGMKSGLKPLGYWNFRRRRLVITSAAEAANAVGGRLYNAVPDR